MTVTRTDVQDRRADRAGPTVRAVCWHCPRSNPGQVQGKGLGREAREIKRQLSERTHPTLPVPMALQAAPVDSGRCLLQEDSSQVLTGAILISRMSSPSCMGQDTLP